MQAATNIMVMVLSVLASRGKYMSKADAAIAGVEPTSREVLKRLDIEPTEYELEKFGPMATSIVSWMTDVFRPSTEFDSACVNALELADTEPHKVIGYLAYIPELFRRQQAEQDKLKVIKNENDFIADCGITHSGTGEVINIRGNRILFNDKVTGCLGSFYVNDEPPSIGDRINYRGRVRKHIFGVPFTTCLSHVKWTLHDE